VATISLILWVSSNYYMMNWGLEKFKIRIEKRAYKKEMKIQKKSNDFGNYGRQI
jgi:hypothetical protein